MKKIIEKLNKLKISNYYEPSKPKKEKNTDIDYKKEYQKLYKEYIKLKENYKEKIYSNFLTRRSIRKFSREKKPGFETIYKIIETGINAPVAGNVQNYKIILVENDELKKEIAKYSYQQYWVADAPYIIIVVREDLELVNMYPDNGKLFSIQNVAACIENIIMATHFFELATCWVACGNNNALKETLDIPEHQNIDAILPIGYPLEKPDKPVKTKIENLLFFNKLNNRER